MEESIACNTACDNNKLFVNRAHSEVYRTYRPTYPPAVLEAILAYLTSKAHKASGPFDLAVDIACGTGQATSPLAEHFQKVIGCDVSASQINEARSHNKCASITYQVAPAENMAFLTDGSVDLVTCATGFHYTDRELVCQEVKRILKPTGIFAVYTYGHPALPSPQAQELFDEYFTDIKEYASPQLALIYNQYRDVKLPFKDVSRVDQPLEWNANLSWFIGFLESWSLYQNKLKKHPGTDCLQVLAQKLRLVLTSNKEDDPPLRVTFPLFILMGQKPM